MSNESLEFRLTQLVAEAVNVGLSSQLDVEEVIASFGLASKILLQHAADNGAPKIDPHTAFAKGLAQIAEIQATAYH